MVLAIKRQKRRRRGAEVRVLGAVSLKCWHLNWVLRTRKSQPHRSQRDKRVQRPRGRAEHGMLGMDSPGCSWEAGLTEPGWRQRGLGGGCDFLGGETMAGQWRRRADRGGPREAGLEHGDLSEVARGSSRHSVPGMGIPNWIHCLPWASVEPVEARDPVCGWCGTASARALVPPPGGGPWSCHFSVPWDCPPLNLGMGELLGAQGTCRGLFWSCRARLQLRWRKELPWPGSCWGSPLSSGAGSLQGLGSLGLLLGTAHPCEASGRSGSRPGELWAGFKHNCRRHVSVCTQTCAHVCIFGRHGNLILPTRVRMTLLPLGCPVSGKGSPRRHESWPWRSLCCVCGLG